ncbi:hypothetical protein AHAS_Ahas17G0126900 [Arachis hypogaea]
MQALKHSLRLAEKQLETSKPIPVTYMQTLTERLTAWKLPKRKLRLVAVRSKTQVAFGMFFGCMNATCWKSGYHEFVAQKIRSARNLAATSLALIGFQHVSRVGEMRGRFALLSALVERWKPKTHTFHLLVGEVTVTLEDMAYILGLSINWAPVTGRSESSHQFLVENCIACFSREPGPQDHVLGKVNLACVRRCIDTEPCDTQESVERYIRAHILCVLGTVVLPDKSTTSLNSKFLPLFRNFHRISGYSWV